MALTKTKTDLLGTQASLAATTSNTPQSGSLRDITGKVGVAFIFRCTYSGVTPTVRPKLEIFTAGENNASYQDITAYETVELSAPITGSGVSASYQITLPIRFVEDLAYINWTMTPPTFSAGTVTAYVGIVETNL